MMNRNRFQVLTGILLLIFVHANWCLCDDERPKVESDDVGFPKVKHMIDTHIHLYDSGRPEGIPWPPKNDTVLYKPHLPAEFKQVSKESGLTGVVIVEASNRLADNKWVLDLIEGDEFFVALVGNIDPTNDTFKEQLNVLKKDKRFVGVRARNPKPIDYTNATVLKNFEALAKEGLSLDFLCNGQGVKGVQEVDAVARAVPGLRIVVDHVLGYNIDGKRPGQDWIDAVERLAQNKNVYCKISGLYQRCVQQPAPSDSQHYLEVLDVLYKNFGQKRVVFGSNWPCTKKSGDYSSYVRLVNAYFASKGQEACEDYFWRNASTAYGLGLK
ncbi:amidohydrolase family protein [Pirellulaceae bacterium]|jgi:predicted TIM-barrel fold metal-dependent hydrolase|nr:amidohydrolase family protein [Pirellulaceae bacterium]